MQACGLVVEYNPFHNGHLYHIREAKKIANVDCIIAVMSGSFLQRGEPAIVDKFHRARAALQAGVDLVLELPYAFAVQSSQLFAAGAVRTLNEARISSLCFGSEQGLIQPFITNYDLRQNNKKLYDQYLHQALNSGLSYPKASHNALIQIQNDTSQLELDLPNNILGASYVNEVLDSKLDIELLTIKRVKSNYHDEEITSEIASATSIRKTLLENKKLTNTITNALPSSTVDVMNQYYECTSTWHHWEHYFPLLRYKIMTLSTDELNEFHSVDEGLENRIKKIITRATSFQHLIELIKTKRYTWTRLQRLFVHILTHTRKREIEDVINEPIPYIRILGMNDIGQKYLNEKRKSIDVPIIQKLVKDNPKLLQMEERATNAYLSILNPTTRQRLFKQELRGPIFIKHNK